MKKKMTLVGAADSLGVPYTRDNVVHEGFYEMFEKDLRRCFELTSINCFHMSTNNDNKYIRKLVLEDLTLADVKQSQNKMLRKCKYSGIYPFLELPKSFLGHYKAEDVDKEMRIYRKNVLMILIFIRIEKVTKKCTRTYLEWCRLISVIKPMIEAIRTTLSRMTPKIERI